MHLIISSRNLRRLAVATGLAALAASAEAGTVYVSAPGNLLGTSSGAHLLVTNSVAATGSGKWLALPDDTDGTVRATPATSFSLAARQTVVLDGAAGFRGLLEVSIPEAAFVSAEFIDAAGIVRALPVIASQDAFDAGSKVALPGLTRSATVVTDVTLVNLDKVSSSCTVNYVNAAGAALGPQQVIALKPLSQKTLGDVLAGVAGVQGIDNAAALVSCTKAYQVHGWVNDTAALRSRALVIDGSGRSAYFPPGEEPACPPGATCQKIDGLVHEASRSNPTAKVSFPAPVGTYGRMRLTLDVEVDDFFPGDPDGKHLIYWFVVNKNIDMPGMLYFRGPASFTALARHGINLQHADKKKMVGNFAAQKGRTYRCVNDYDMARGVVKITVTDLETGEVKVTLTGTPNVSKYTFKSGDRLVVSMGFEEGKIADEVPAYGWRWSDMKVDVFP
jgi:hypothetical protein